MEEKRDQEEMMKHVCRLCNKRYPSGKSLGGHMRSHVIAAANSHKNNNNNNKPIIIHKKVIHFHHDDDDDIDDDDDGNEEEEEDDEEEEQREGKQSGYGLRENPKKTWRLVDSTLNNKQQQVVQFEQQERVCKQCGKRFNSLKALCGHMSSHSDLNHHKDANFMGGDEDEDDEEEEEEEDVSWSSGSKDQLLISAIESHSDNNNNNSNKLKKRQTRATMSRYKSLTAVDSVSPTANGGGSGGGDGGGGGGGGGSSSNHSEIDQHEQEEVAMCLMMLSRDCSSSSAAVHNNNKSCLNFTTAAAAAESSDNNSVILEGGSSNNYVGLNNVVAAPNTCGIKEGLIKDHDNNKKKKKIKVVGEQEQVEMDNSDSGYFENGAKELESDDSVDGFVRNFGFKKPKYEFGSSFNNNNSYEDGNGGDYSRKSSRIREVGHHFRFDSPESDENSSKKIINNNNGYYSNSNNTNNLSIKKGSKYECWVCNKTFKTHQALGGHIISHRKNGENSSSLLETKISAKKLVATTTATAAKVVPSKAKKAKGHKCPYCPKVFKSGQALGGHKRSHMIGSSSNSILHLDNEKSKVERNPPTRLDPVQQQKHQPPPLIDLNLPAPMEEEGSGNSQFVAW